MKKKQDKLSETKPGFTIVEVTLVTAFVAMLLIAIATVIMSISAIFQKGLTLKGVNTVGRNLITEFTTAINAAPSIDSASLCNMYLSGDSANRINREACLQDAANNYIFQERMGDFHNNKTNEDYHDVQYYGVFCTGTYSYLWNTYYGAQSNHTISLTYLDNHGDRKTIPGPDDDESLRLVRFEDKTYHACTQNVNASYQMTNGFYGDPSGASSDHVNIDMTQLDNGQPNLMSTEPQQGFLESSDSDVNLDLYEFVIFPPSQDMVTLRAFFAGTFILATNNGDVNIMRGGDYCDPSGAGLDTSSNLFDLGSAFNYCGINKFNFAARTAGSGI